MNNLFHGMDFTAMVRPQPFSFPGFFAPLLAQQRMPATQDNPFAAMEAHTSKLISQSLDNYRSARDGASERLFSLLYGKN